MTAKINVTVDTATLSPSPVERLLRQHEIPYDVAGTEPRGEEVEGSGGSHRTVFSFPIVR